jgi:hypothetical protein
MSANTPAPGLPQQPPANPAGNAPVQGQQPTGGLAQVQPAIIAQQQQLPAVQVPHIAQPAMQQQAPIIPQVVPMMPVQQAVRFAISPAHLDNPLNLIDYSTPDGKKQYKAATAALEEIFELKTDTLKVFLNGLATRSLSMNWDEILLIPSIDNPLIQHSLLTNYGSVSSDDVKQFAETMWTNQARQAQLDHQLYVCLQKSLSTDAKKKILNELAFCKAHGNLSGIMLLKRMIQAVYVDNMATSSHIRRQLLHIETIMKQSNYNIVKFNDHVQGLLTDLAARGETTEDKLLVIALFDAYMTVTDHEFVEYIKGKWRNYEDSSVNYTPMSIMEIAANKYKSLTEKGIWNAPSVTTQLIALQALQQQILQKTNNNRSRMASLRSERHITFADDKVNDTAPAAKKGRQESTTRTRERQPPAEWQKTEPKSGEPRQITRGNKTFHWCPHHRLWNFHRAEECRLKNRPATNQSGASNKGKPAKKATLSEAQKKAALTTILEDEDDLSFHDS